MKYTYYKIGLDTVFRTYVIDGSAVFDLHLVGNSWLCDVSAATLGLTPLSSGQMTEDEVFLELL